MSWDVESFREKIELEHKFPETYTFKFIVPIDKKGEILGFLPEGDVSFRESSNGNYVSITSKIFFETSQGVLDVYMVAHKVEGCIAL